MTSLAEFDTARAELIDHPLYSQITTEDRLRVFMKHHVFAVWDFFTLLKRLQTEVTTVTLPWRPRGGRADHGRFIMEIVLAEETDEDIGGGYISHFELYRRAMDEIGADAGPIDGFLAGLDSGLAPMAALKEPRIPASVQEFVGHTLEVALNGAPHEVASSFCHGRENLLPDVFSAVRANVDQVLANAPVFRHYLDRHIALDHDEHGPLALRLLASMCDGDPVREAEAAAVSVAAVRARTRLWDGVLAEFDGRR
ncbi:MAG: PROBABLE REMNANT OF A TRANSPOSASE GENE PROTEIN [uncultured Corynebacteriales bacterium]|uniref:PROBABLE REMNANT OF A TRANSPOSASE GENE PROTEIN n=1 Tax=uncultured Mycobacteriales bacterium TaxID=581187 RepID=A0A6J4J2H3_9ACTN|nr:MAG: PROBABLE REMNANT OF A TRANSPOSASE GENE PROTEIN [uncultured Corynebacteriales bacterium]